MLRSVASGIPCTWCDRGQGRKSTHFEWTSKDGSPPILSGLERLPWTVAGAWGEVVGAGARTCLPGISVLLAYTLDLVGCTWCAPAPTDGERAAPFYPADRPTTGAVRKYRSHQKTGLPPSTTITISSTSDSPATEAVIYLPRIMHKQLTKLPKAPNSWRDLAQACVNSNSRVGDCRCHMEGGYVWNSF